MTTAREQILGDIRKSLRGDAALPADDAAKLEQRLSNHPAGLIPRRSDGRDRAGLTALFEQQAKLVETSVRRIASLADVPAAVAEYLSSQNLPAGATVAPDKLLDQVPWSERPMLRLRRGKPEPTDQVGVSVAFQAIAETGTLMLLSGAESPSTLNFLPDTHIVILPKSRIVGPMEEALRRLRDWRQAASAGMPRTVNFITGPSRTADIEQKIEMGAHGPRRQHILIVEDDRLA
ncbi:MAG TPA: lactate utilization protein C [Alphaproteobacteria bacterium]